MNISHILFINFMNKHKNIILNYFNFFYIFLTLHNHFIQNAFNYLSTIIQKQLIMLYGWIKKILVNLSFQPNFKLYAFELSKNLLSNQHFKKQNLFLIILQLYFKKFGLIHQLIVCKEINNLYILNFSYTLINLFVVLLSIFFGVLLPNTI